MRTMQDYELDAWLGDTEATDEQRAALLRAADEIGARWPEPDDADVRTEAFTAAATVVLGDAADVEMVDSYRQARRAAREAQARMTGAIIAGQIIAPESEVAQAARLGVSRLTIRKAMRK